MLLWDHLKNLASIIPDNWIIGGDFNIYTDLDDKLGSGLHNIGAITEFVNVIQELKLIDPGFRGSRFTWFNGQEAQDALWERIDRIMINIKLLQQNNQISVTRLPIHLSDHSPILVECNTHSIYRGPLTSSLTR